MFGLTAGETVGVVGVLVILVFIVYRAWKNRKPGSKPKTGGGKPFEPK